MPRERPPLEPDPVIEFYKKDLDLTLIDRQLSLTVEERFERLMELQRFAEELRRAGREARATGRRAAPSGCLASATLID